MKRSKRHLKLLGLALFALFGCILPAGARAQHQSVSDLMKQAVEAGMNRDDLQALQTRAENRGIEAGQLREILELSLSMSRNDLPSDFIIQKAMEGFSKGVPADRIMGVLNRMQQSTQQAAGIVGAWMKKDGIDPGQGNKAGEGAGRAFRNEMVKACGKTISQGVSGDAVRTILSGIDGPLMQKIHPTDVVAAVAILPDLPESVRRGKGGRAFMRRVLESGFSAEELQQLPAAMKMAQGRSQLPASAVLEGVSRQMKGGVPAQQILHNLANGHVGGGPPGGTPKGLEHKNNHGNNGQGH